MFIKVSRKSSIQLIIDRFVYRNLSLPFENYPSKYRKSSKKTSQRRSSRFFNHLNIVFRFVADDLIDKFDLLDSMHRGDPEHNLIAQKMIAFEQTREDKTGTVALLRLLRALEFTYLFLDRAVVSPTDSSSTREVAWQVYKETLHKRHNKAFRMGIWAATATIPKRESLRRTLSRGEAQPQTAEKVFPVIERVYRDIHRLYEENDLLELIEL